MTDLTGLDIDRYHIEDRLGEGGMATVYRALDARLERSVAFKVIRRDAFSPDMMRQVVSRFDREARALAQLSHPNIVKVYDYGTYDDAPFFVMEYIPGGTLKDRAGEIVSWDAAVRMLLPIARALAYAHSQGVVHRDLKPANILLTASGEPMLSDFGIAKIIEEAGATTLTGTGVGIGTPEYMAPEQGMGREIDGRADVYALGIVLYEMITGRRPYEADTPMAVVLKHITDPLPNPRRFVPNLPLEVIRVLEKALAKEAGNRYASMDNFYQALESLLLDRKSLTESPSNSIDDDSTLVEPSRMGDQAQVTRKARMEIPWYIWLGGFGAVFICVVFVAVALLDVPSRMLPILSSSVNVTPTDQPLVPSESPFPITLTDTPVVVVMATSTQLDSEPTGTPQQQSTETPEEIAPSPTTVDDSIRVARSDQMAMVLIPAGEFIMGLDETDIETLFEMCPDCDKNGLRDATPQKIVYLDAFWIDRTEVTNSQFTEFVASTGYRTTAELNGYSFVLNIQRAAFDQIRGVTWTNFRLNANHPVVHVSWDDAAAYCSWAGRRLPNEAEWEKAARGVDGRLFPWGDDQPDADKVNFYRFGAEPEPVGSYPNGNSPYGVWDLSGNVWEWVADWYNAEYYASMPPNNPLGPSAGDGRVYRGGSWASRMQYELISLTSSARKWNYVNLSRDNLGFRCAESIP